MKHETSRAAEGTLVNALEPDAVAHARALHHLATADPERDGLLTGAAHELKYGLERAEDTIAAWRARGVHPTENRALLPGEDGAENLRGAELETATVSTDATERTAAPRAKK